MSGTLSGTPCPQCKKINVLYISIDFVVKPFGILNLDEALKVSGRQQPVLKCTDCDFTLVGEFSGVHGSHVVFKPPTRETKQ